MRFDATHLRTGMRRRTGLCILTVLAMSACGGDDDAPAADAAPVDADAVAGCLTDAGFDLTESPTAVPLGDELTAALGIVDSIPLGAFADGNGIGDVTFYDSDDHAAEALESVRATSTDEVMVGRVGDAVYHYVATQGDGTGLDTAIESCLG